MAASSARKILLVALILALAASAWLLLRRSRVTPVTPEPSTSAATSATATAAGQPAEATGFAAELARTQTIANRAQRMREFGRVFQAWVQADPAAALAWLRQQSREMPEYASALLMGLDALARTDADAALRLARELAVTPEQQAVYSALFAHFADLDLAAAAKRLEAVPAGLPREHALRAVASSWSRQNVNAALTWAEGLTGADREIAVESVLADLVTADPLRAIEIAQKNLRGAALERVLGTAVRQLVKSDPAAAAALVPLLPEGETQTFAATAVARSKVAADPVQAMAWAKALTSADSRRAATRQALEAWTTQDATAAGRHVQALPADAEQRDAAATVAAVMALSDAPSALAWAQTLPVADAREAALLAAANAWSQREGATATRWVAEHLAQFGPRAPQALQATHSYWKLQNAPEARAWLESANLPAELKAKMGRG